MVKRIAHAEQDVLNEQIGYVSSGIPKGTSLDWSLALETLTTQNARFRRGVAQLDDLEEERKKFYWNELGPRLTAVSSLSASLDELSSLSSDDISIQIFGGLRLPQPLTLYGQRYALELKYYTAILDFEDFRRKITADLYEVFITQRKLDQDIFEEQNSALRTQPQDLKQALLNKVAQTDKRNKIRHSQQQERIRQRLNSLLNSPGKHWQLQTNSLPRVNYDKRYQSLSFQNGFGRLGLRQTAAQIEASNASLKKIKVDRLPSLSLNLSLPTLYSSDSDADPSFEDIRLFSGLNKSLNFNNNQAKTRRSAEERARETRSGISLRLDHEATQFHELKRRFEEALTVEKLLKRKKNLLTKSPPPALADLLLAHISELQKVKDDLSRSTATKDRIALEFWIWDEDAWAATQRQPR